MPAHRTPARHSSSSRRDPRSRQNRPPRPNPSTSTSTTWSAPDLARAPNKFKIGRKNKWMQGRFLRNSFNLTEAELISAGAKYYADEKTKSKAKKFALYHVYDYAKWKGMSEERAMDGVDRVLGIQEKSSRNYQKFLDGGPDMDDFMDDFMCGFY